MEIIQEEIQFQNVQLRIHEGMIPSVRKGLLNDKHNQNL